MKVVISNPRILGVMPQSNPPELAWHSFQVFSDNVEHSINDTLRAIVPTEHFDEYVKGQDSFAGLVYEFDTTIQVPNS